MINHEANCTGIPCSCENGFTPRYTDHRDELISLQRQYIDGNSVTIDGFPLRNKINELTRIVREERATQRHREAPLPLSSDIEARGNAFT